MDPDEIGVDPLSDQQFARLLFFSPKLPPLLFGLLVLFLAALSLALGLAGASGPGHSTATLGCGCLLLGLTAGAQKNLLTTLGPPLTFTRG
jgi:hypothetical protein